MKEYSKNLGKVSLTAEGAWTNSKSYEVLCIVYDEHNNHGFISKKYVPAGVDLYNGEYWMPLNVSGYADNNIIILSKQISDTAIQSYTLEEAIKSIAAVGRRPGAVLGFYNENSDRLDIGGCWELWQFNSTTISEWENIANWQNIYYNYNKFVGWYRNESELKQYVPFPEIGCYAFVGYTLNEASVYCCNRKYVWVNTTEHAWDYVKIIVQGNVTVGENGNWFNNGVDTNIPASVKGENGKTPIIRNNDNIFEVSYDNENWEKISDEIAAWFRINNNKLEMSRHKDGIWEVMSDFIAAWFRWQSQGGQQANSTGKIQITRDGITWTDLSGEFVNNLRISRYIGTDESLPTSGIAEGTIYAKGPYYKDTDTNHDYPAYRIWVYAWKGDTLAWIDHGQFTSIAAGIVQETGNSEVAVMSQKAVTEKLSELGSKIDSETTRARQAESALSKSISDEIDRAKESEEELENSINANRYGYNVTVNGLKGGIHTIETAIKDVPSKFRLLGQKITFRTENGDWATYHNESLSLDNYENVNDWVQEVGISSVQGDVNITNAPDYEDLTEAANGTIKFADKEYNKASFSGLGRVYLRKNIVDEVNVLTQDMVSKANTIYIIQYDYDLNGAEITIPEGCVLNFQGGSLNNGIVISNYTRIVNINKNLDILGKIYNYYGEEITINGDLIRRSMKLYYDLYLENPTSNTYKVDKYGKTQTVKYARNLGITDAVAILHIDNTTTDGVTKISTELTSAYVTPNTYVETLRINGIYELVGIKFHRNGGYFNQDIGDPIDIVNSYCNCVAETVNILKSLGLKFTYVWILNECDDWIRKDFGERNEIYLEPLVNLSNNIKSLGYIPRISHANPFLMKMMRHELGDVAESTLNYYPNLSFLDGDSVYSTDIVQSVCQDLNKIKGYNLGRFSISNICISECGCIGRSKALRRTSVWQQDGTSGDLMPEIISLHWNIMADVFNEVGIAECCIWFIEWFADKYSQVVDECYKLFNYKLK